MPAIIYQITNTVNGKCYVGQTALSLDERWRKHRYESRETRKAHRALYSAIRKYGFAQFTIKVLEETDVESLNAREIFWIAAIEPEYNMTIGGDTIRGYRHSAETKQKMSESAKRRGPNRPIGYLHTIESKEKMSRSQKLRWAKLS